MVWMQIIGKRKSQSLDFEKHKIKNILVSLNIDLAFLSDTSFNSKYNPKNWCLKKDDRFENVEYFEYSLSENNQTNSLDSIRIVISNPEFIEFSGPFDFFARWYQFANDESNVTENWQKIFQSFSKSYGIKELIYFPEDFFPLEYIYYGESSTNELFEMMEESNPQKKLFGLSNFEYYKETVES